MSKYMYRYRIGRGWSNWKTRNDWTVEKFLNSKDDGLLNKSVKRSKKYGLVWTCTDSSRQATYDPFWELIFDSPSMLEQELIARELKEKNEQRKI